MGAAGEDGKWCANCRASAKAPFLVTWRGVRSTQHGSPCSALGLPTRSHAEGFIACIGEGPRLQTSLSVSAWSSSLRQTMIGSGVVHLRHSSLQVASASLRTAGDHLQHAACVSASLSFRYMHSADSHLHSCRMSWDLPRLNSQPALWHYSLT